ncbi:MAG: DNA-directed DNA polymerase [Candidatus Aenigmatarchaeota archaeon]
MKLYLLDADYFDENNQTVLRLFCKDNNGKTVIALDYNFEPYFYILPKQGKENEVKKRVEKIKPVKKTEIVEKIINGEKRKFVKVICYLSTDVQKVRDIVKEWEKERGGIGIVENEYEYSLSFYKRYLIDKQIEGWIEVEGKEIKKNYKAEKVIEIEKIKPIENTEIPKLKLMAFDIECVEEDGKQKIVMLSLFGGNFKKVLTYQKDKHYDSYVKVVNNEKEILEKFVEIINKEEPDILLGYNSDLFDFQIIQQKADELKVKLILSKDLSELKFSRRARISAARLKGLVHIDLFGFINNILSPQLQTEVLTLDAVSSELLNDKKIEIEYEEILEDWRKGKDLAKLAEYCLKDSELTLRLGNFLLPQIFELSKLPGQLLFDVSRMTYSQLVEWYLTKKAFSMNYIIPNQPKWEEIQKRKEVSPYVGGFVKEPIAGLHEDIAVMDFRSLYPSLIASFNISPENLNCTCCRKDGYEVPETKYWFCKRKKGFVSTVIKELIEKRAQIKEKMKKMKNSEEWNRLNREQFAIKTISNATYGYFGFSGSKWYCRECAESSAAFGRFYIKRVIDEAEKEGFTVIYADTDSMFVKTKNKLKENVKTFLEKINKILPGIIELDLQGFYKRGLFIPKEVGFGTAKKRYALIDENGVLTVRGLETVRKDWCNLAKNVQRKVLELVLNKKDIQGAVKYVQNVINDLKQKKVSLKDLIIYEQLTKPLSEYKAIGPHVVAARKIKERGRPIGEGMVIMFVITKGKGSISERAEPFEDVDITDIDVEYYIHHQIAPAALRVLTVLGVTEERLLGKNLKSFLN